MCFAIKFHLYFFAYRKRVEKKHFYRFFRLIFVSLRLFRLILAYFTFVFTSEFWCFASKWNMWNQAFFRFNFKFRFWSESEGASYYKMSLRMSCNKVLAKPYVRYLKMNANRAGQIYYYSGFEIGILTWYSNFVRPYWAIICKPLKSQVIDSQPGGIDSWAP